MHHLMAYNYQESVFSYSLLRENEKMKLGVKLSDGLNQLNQNNKAHGQPVRLWGISFIVEGETIWITN